MVFAHPLRLVGAEDPIPNDEHPRVVGITGGAVMDPVGHRRVEHVLERPRQAADEVGVDPEHVERVKLRVRREGTRVQPEQRHRKVEDVHESLADALTKACAKVVVLARVVHSVAEP